MQKALCNATADGDGDHIHICVMEHTAKDSHGKVHMCKCGVFFADVKKSEIDRAGKTLEKTQ